MEFRQLLLKQKSRKKIQDIFYFENAIHRVLYERTNSASSDEYLKFPKFSSGMWVASDQKRI